MSKKFYNRIFEENSYTFNQIIKILFLENPGISKSDCYKKAIILYREMNILNKKSIRDNRKYNYHNIPLSCFGDSDDIF